MLLTVLETAAVADSVADFSVLFKSVAAVETVPAMDAGDNGAAGKASAMVSGSVAVAASVAASAMVSGAASAMVSVAASVAASVADAGGRSDSNDADTSSGSSKESGAASSALGLMVTSRLFSFMVFVIHSMILSAVRSPSYSRGALFTT